MNTSIKSRSLFSKILMALMLVYALLDFFPVNASLGFLLFWVIAFVCACYCLIFPQQRLIDRTNDIPVSFFVIWLSYALLSYLWAIEKKEAIVYCLIILRSSLLFTMYGALFRNRKIRERAHWFLIVVMLGYLSIAIWELITRHHLPISRLYGSFVPSPSGPFYGENVLAAFLILFLPYIIMFPKLYNRRSLKYLSGLWILLILSITIIQGARIALISAILLLLYIVLFHSSKSSKLISMIFVIMLIIGISHFAPAVYELTIKGMQKELSSIGLETESARMSSVKIRKQLFVEGGDLLTNSYFMGVGGGNFERYMDTDRIYRTGGITNPHNYFLELAGNFGLGILFLFLSVYIRWVYLLAQKVRFGDPGKRNFYLMNLLSLLMFIPASAIPSSIKWNFLIWIYFAYINSIAVEDDAYQHLTSRQGYMPDYTTNLLTKAEVNERI